MGIFVIALLICILLINIIGLYMIKNKETTSSLEKNIDKLGESLRTEFFRNREEQSKNLKDLGEQQNKLLEKAEQKLEEIRKDNNEKLEKMRETVDEKLHKTLEDRLNKSFSQVSERLEEVHKGLGEMQSLAEGVGDLKKVLSNVKSRGILGEIQLENILEQILTPEQYEKNVQIKKESQQRVEFAIKFPKLGDDDNECWLPIDSKFPLEIYTNLLDAYDSGELKDIDKAKKKLNKTIKNNAKEISKKYISPPNTIDCGILFLPIEGLFAEVVRLPGLIETLQKDYRVNIVGPTTLLAFLTSLQMGFRSLVIEKRSSEVWRILGAVKTEFEKFGDILEKAKNKIRLAGDDIEDLVGKRTRVMSRKLKDVEKLPVTESVELLDNNAGDIDEN